MKAFTYRVIDEVSQALIDADISARQREALLALLKALSVSLEKGLSEEAQEKNIQIFAQNLISNSRLLAKVLQQADELEALKRISVHLTSSLKLEDVLQAVVQEAMWLLPNARTAHIFLYDSKKEILIFGAALNENGQQSVAFSNPRPSGITATVARSGEAIIVPDMRTHPIYADTPKSWTGAIISIPLKVENRVVGVMNLSRSHTGEFSDEELRMIYLLADHAAIAIANASLHEMVSQQAKIDILTGLPNRRALDEQLEFEIKRSARSGQPFSVVMLDLDGFKKVNDTYGHEIGDIVLRKTFTLLSHSIRSTDFLARYGGDELTLILPDTDLDAALLVSTKLKEKLAELEIELPDHKTKRMGISGGVSMYPLHGKTAADLLRASDAALYRAKKYQRGTMLKARGPTDQLGSP